MAKAQLFRLEDFSGGYNPDVPPQLIGDNQATDILNFRLDQVGSLVSRRGVEPWGNAGPPPYDILAIGALRDPVMPNNSIVVIASDSGDLYTSLSGNSWASPGSWKPATPGGNPRFLSAQDVVFVTSGVGSPKVLDSVGVLSDLGVSAPTSAPGAAVASGGSLAVGDFEYVYTVVRTSDGAESNPSPRVPVITAGGNLSVTLTLPAAATGTTRNVYRTDANSVSGVLKFLGSFGTSTSITDDGSTATSDLAPPVDHDPPPSLEFLAYYGGRYFGAIGNKVYWSYPLNSAYWPGLNVTTVPFQGNDQVQALVAFQDSLLILGKRNTLLLSGTQDDASTMGSWQIIRLDTEIGLTAPNAVAELGSQLVFLSDDGLRVYPGFSPLAGHIQRELTAIPYSKKRTAAMLHVPEERSIWLCVGEQTYVIHLPNQAVTFYDIPFTCSLPGGRQGNDWPLFSNGASVLQYGTVEIDAGAASIPVKWVSKMFQIGLPESVKFFRRIGAFATKGSGTNVTITVRDRGEIFTVNLSQVSGLGESHWNEFNWNQASWAGGGLAYFIATLPGHRLLGRNMQIEIRAEVTQHTEVSPPISLLYREANRFLGV